MPQLTWHERHVVLRCVSRLDGHAMRRMLEESQIAGAFGPEIPALAQISLSSPWRTDEIELDVDAPTAAAIASGTYRDWDGLNAEFRVAAIDPGSDGDYSDLTIRFWTNWRTDKVAARYSALEGVMRTARLPTHNLFDDPSNSVCVRLDSGKRMYLFRESWGDCPSGCINNLFWYFSATANAVNYAGHWNPSSTGFFACLVGGRTAH